MNNNNIEQLLSSAVEHATPDVREKILSSCDRGKGKVIKMEKKNNRTLKSIAAIAAVFVLIAAGIFIGRGLWNDTGAVFDDTLAAVVSLDVNPSVELNVNKGEKVISARGLNEDGVSILGNMDLKGTDLEVAVNAVVGSMLRHGYIDEMANSILLSVSGNGGFDADALKAKLSSEIDAMLTNGAVLSQNVSDVDDDVRLISEKYGISLGKAALIEEIIDSNERHNAKELSSLTINELNLISSDTDLNNIKSEGKASDKAYIGEDAALNAALKHAKLNKSDVSGIEIDLDYEHGCMVYEIEFNRGADEYDYDINALTGEIVEYETEINGVEDHGASSGAISGKTDSTTEVKPSGDKLSRDEAIAIALKKAGLSKSDVTIIQAELERDDGREVFEIEFVCKGYEYSCDVDITSGKVYDFEREYDDDYRPSENKTPAENKVDKVISKDEAKSIALKKAGLSADQVKKIFVDLEKDDGKLIYEIEFKLGGYEYSFEIDAVNGSILDYEKELDD